MKYFLITLLTLGAVTSNAETTVRYTDSAEVFKIKSATVALDRDGAYLILALSNGLVEIHNKLGGYKDAKELAADLMDPNSVQQITIIKGWSNFYLK